jgi:hypothetical protein
MKVEARSPRCGFDDFRLQAAGVSSSTGESYGVAPQTLKPKSQKLIVIGEDIAYVGINFEHNADWHDMMFRIEDRDAVAFLHRISGDLYGRDSHHHGKFDGWKSSARTGGQRALFSELSI